MRTWGERQYTLIGHDINCTRLLITIRLYSISSATGVLLPGVLTLSWWTAWHWWGVSDRCPDSPWGGVRCLGEVTARVHVSHPNGGVSSWIGSGYVSLGRDWHVPPWWNVNPRRLGGLVPGWSRINPRRLGGPVPGWSRKCPLGVPLVVSVITFTGPGPFDW